MIPDNIKKLGKSTIECRVIIYIGKQYRVDSDVIECVPIRKDYRIELYNRIEKRLRIILRNSVICHSYRII